MANAVFGQEYLASRDVPHSIRLRLLDGPLDLAWKHSSMTSDFIAEIVALRFRSVKRHYNEVRHDIGYLTNELIENAIKFRTSGEVAVEAGTVGDSFSMKVSNFVERKVAVRFQQLIRTVTAGDPGDLLIQQIEASAATDSNASGLGLLTLMSDYQVHLAWHFQDDGPHSPIRLETYAAMAISPS